MAKLKTVVWLAAAAASGTLALAAQSQQDGSSQAGGYLVQLPPVSPQRSSAPLAVRLRSPPEGCLFHSDRGSQYCSYDYQKRLQAFGLRPSMSGKGNCYDNASVETFFKSLKAELIWRQSWPTRRQAEAAIFQYINGFYNTRRRHSYLGGISPLAFEAKVA